MNIFETIKNLFSLPKVENKTPWMVVAIKELGVKEKNGGEESRIIEYHSATSLRAKIDEVPWCSAFVCWVLKTSGYANTNSAMARSYLNYGEKLSKPEYGCIVILKRGSFPNGHVGFYNSETATHIEILGGNQGDKVCLSKFKKEDVLDYRWPVKAVELKPLP